jgi:acetoin utilization protein AcuB
MRLRDIMKTRVQTISVSESAETALYRMKQARIRHLVVKDGEQIVGIVSDRDIASMGAMRQVETVEEVMRSPAVVGRPDMTPRQAANLLRGRTIGCLPLFENGELVGIITITDLLELIGRGAEKPASRSKRWILKDRGPRKNPVSNGRQGMRRKR